MSIGELISNFFTPLTWVILGLGFLLLVAGLSFLIYVNGLRISRGKKNLMLVLAFFETSAFVFLLLATGIQIYTPRASVPTTQELETLQAADFPSSVPTQTFTPIPWPSATSQISPASLPTSTPPGVEAFLEQSYILVSVSERGENFGEIYRLEPNGTNWVNLTNHPANDYAAVASPNGGTILFTSNRGQGDGLYLMEADGSHQRVLYDTPGNERDGSWSPDGLRIVFMSETDGQSDLYIIGVDGQDLQRLTDEAEIELEPAWSPRGDDIAFSMINKAGDALEIFLIGTDGANLRQLTRYSGSNIAPRWSPDGSQIVYISSYYHNTDLFIMNADGSDPKVINYTREYNEADPAWSPDGHWLVFTRFDPDQYLPELFILAIDGSHLNQIHYPNPLAYLSTPGWMKKYP